MFAKLAIGQKVRFNKRVVLSERVPKNAAGYKYAILVPREGDKYEGAGVIERGTEATVVDYASHGTVTADVPIIEVRGRRARCHVAHLDLS